MSTTQECAHIKFGRAADVVFSVWHSHSRGLVRTASGAQGQLSIVSGEGGQAGCLVWGIRPWFFAPLSSDDSDGVNGRLGRWWCIRKLPKNARHCEIPILEPTVKSNVGSWGVGSRHLQVQHDELSFLLALQVCVAPSVVAY